MHLSETQAAGQPLARRLFVCNGGFLTAPRLRRILALAGWSVRLGLPGPDDHVGVWGNSPTAWRGRALAKARRARLVHVEDAFLRSVLPGRARGRVARRGPIGLMIDPHGIHFDPSRPSVIDACLSRDMDAETLARARDCIDRLIAADVSKYNIHLPEENAPPPGYVLVIDQTRGDASLMGADRHDFLRMLDRARAENPDLPLIVRTHPETASGLRPGHFLTADLRPGEAICDTPVSPWRLLAGARQVYAMSSLLGYEAVLAGHRPRIFGKPFYAGRGLTQDEQPVPDRQPATVEALFAASHLLAPTWYDPCRDRLTDFETVLSQLEAEARAWRQDRNGHRAYGIRLWKRPLIARFFGNGRGVRFCARPGPDITLAWAGKASACPNALRIEDGFLRSRGLGAALVPPLSLVADDLGIYYDPGRESRLERLMATPLTPQQKRRAQALHERLLSARLTKYNLGGPLPALPTGHRILVPGQVQDDASVRLGGGAIRDNLSLLQLVRAHRPQSVVIYKPHPDVQAGLRPGAISADELRGVADVVVTDADMDRLLAAVDEVWTITSTTGFEALLRGLPVTTVGAPFYAGLGLTNDLGPVPSRRQAGADMLRLIHAALIAYPRYHDPVSDLPCPVEVVVDRLCEDHPHEAGGRVLRILAKLQGLFSTHAWLWRR
ncbi:MULTISPECIES: capsular polysaccharide biosynthesis protein [unclassified Paracoccus (in: a-proteobacteria)]|uniref:capsular polysaccharide biosynthesis protein n=1 Tax=unclassified Paracoccus (in: a-proteobacteria) TaxID=2688777 RepID=UPI0012B1E84F|nr:MULTISPECIES: capsular polysaccharide biosynthesis protein [unclassified Paracoccus (in: a-proteobacteria)]UXU74512.1 capsular polysaccharide biosynthesis protein [Paracoccus sp. SMMA_5]UXU80405.1 capsular polysaccharide biosynthesis protein [Paracoccus sp. SMMA_5_TC]